MTRCDLRSLLYPHVSSTLSTGFTDTHTAFSPSSLVEGYPHKPMNKTCQSHYSLDQGKMCWSWRRPGATWFKVTLIWAWLNLIAGFSCSYVTPSALGVGVFFCCCFGDTSADSVPILSVLILLSPKPLFSFNKIKFSNVNAAETIEGVQLLCQNNIL